MKKALFPVALVMLFLCYVTVLPAQEEAAATEEPPKAWTTGAGLGLDFSQLFQLNPRQGAGQNRLGLGGAINFFGNLKKGRLAWDNLANWQFGVQRLGSGVITQGGDTKIPFQKAIDELRFNSKLGYKVAENSKLFYAANLGFLSQLTPTYSGTAEYPGNFLTDISNNNATPLSNLFAPATITLSAGIDYQPNEKWSFFYSPVGGKFVIVANDDIAAQGVHGNPVTKDANGIIIDFQNVDSQFGSLLRVNHADKYLNDRLAFTSALLLYSNYLRNPQNIDIDWNNELAFEIITGLQAVMMLNVFYDDDMLVQITDYDAPNGVSGLGKRVSLTQQLLIKYNVVF